MTKELRADLKKLKEDLSNTEKLFGLQAMKNQRANSPMPVVRLPWNYGGNCLRVQSQVHQAGSRLEVGPTCPRSRSRSPSCLGFQSPRNVVHKQTIDAGDKQTIVEVSVKTKRQSRRPSVPRIPTAEYLASKLSNVGISPLELKKCDSSLVNPSVTSGLRKEPSWSNILRHNPTQAIIPDKLSVKRSCEASLTSHQKWKSVCSHVKTDVPDHQKSPDVLLNGVHTTTGLSQQQKLKFLINELKENSRNDPNSQMIILELEDVLKTLPTPENLKPPAQSLVAKTVNVQPSVHRQSNGFLHESPKKVSPCHHKEQQSPETVTEPSLLRLSPEPAPLEHHLKSTGSQGKAAQLIGEFLEILNSAPQSTSPEDKHRLKKSHLKKEQEPVFKKQLEDACRVLEATCKRIEDDCEKLKREKTDMEKILQEREAELQTVLRSRQTMEVELADLRASWQRANTELQTLREEQTRDKELQNVIKEFQKRVDQLSDENKILAVEMNMSRMEKDKLSVLLTNKINEAESYKKEINKVGNGDMIDVEEDEMPVYREEQKKTERPTRKGKQKKDQETNSCYAVGESVFLIEEDVSQVATEEQEKIERLERKRKQMSEESNLETNTSFNDKVAATRVGPAFSLRRNGKKKEKQGNENQQVKMLQKNEEKEKIEDDENHLERDQQPETNEKDRIGKDVFFVSEMVLPLYFLPVDKKWQDKASKDLNFKIVKPLKSRKVPVPLGSPRTCQEVSSDGNCFFRCVSLYLTGSEELHELVRNAVVDFMMVNRSEFEESGDPDYIEKMRTLTTWATEVEIRATSKWLNVPVFTYMKYNSLDWKWQRFGPGLDLTGDDSGVGGLYLKNTASCHYDVVTGVHSSDNKGSP